MIGLSALYVLEKSPVVFWFGGTRHDMIERLFVDF